MPADTVEKTLHLSASPERVWRSLTDPRELARWFPDETDLEPRPGATGSFDWEEHGKYAVRVEEVDPPRRLVWTWARDPDVALGDTPRTRVEWSLEPRDDGGTTLHLVESGFTAPKYRDQNDAGWDQELGELVAYLEGEIVSGEPGT